MRKVFVVRLSQEEREQLAALVKGGKASALKLMRARILLKADQHDRGPAWTDAGIANALDVSLKTVFNIRRKWVEHGIEAALERRRQDGPSKPRKLDGKAEAKLVATCCGPPPKGRAKWTLRLLAAKLVELEAVDSISPETVRQALKKRGQALAEATLVSAEGTRCGVCVAHGRRPRRLSTAI